MSPVYLSKEEDDARVQKLAFHFLRIIVRTDKAKGDEEKIDIGLYETLEVRLGL